MRKQEARRRADAAAARFDASLPEWRAAWAEVFPTRPFEVEGRITQEAMAFIMGYAAGVRRRDV
jgi:hypothetical protein